MDVEDDIKKDEEKVVAEETEAVAEKKEDPADIKSDGERKSENDNGTSSDANQDVVVEQIKQLQKSADENYRQFLRTQADFDNFRRRTRLEKEELYKYASLHLIEQLLPVIDNFDRAVSSSKETRNFDALVKGIEMIANQLDQVLVNEGLRPIEALNQTFNPEFHQAIAQVESEEHEEGIVVEEVQKGYMLKDKVVRPSMVKVSK